MGQAKILLKVTTDNFKGVQLQDRESPKKSVFRIRIQMMRIRIRIQVNLRTNLIHKLQVENFFFLLFYSKKYLADVYLLALRTRITFKTSSFSRLSHKITFY